MPVVENSMSMRLRTALKAIFRQVKILSFLLIFLFRRLIIVTLLQWYNFRTARSLWCIRLRGGMSSLLLVELFLGEGCLGRSPGWSLALSDDFSFCLLVMGERLLHSADGQCISAVVVQSSLWCPSYWCLQFVNPSSHHNKMTAVWWSLDPTFLVVDNTIVVQRLQTHGAYKILPRTPRF